MAQCQTQGSGRLLILFVPEPHCIWMYRSILSFVFLMCLFFPVRKKTLWSIAGWSRKVTTERERWEMTTGKKKLRNILDSWSQPVFLFSHTCSPFPSVTFIKIIWPYGSHWFNIFARPNKPRDQESEGGDCKLANMDVHIARFEIKKWSSHF